MRRVLFTMAILAATVTSFAQEKNVKEAKSIASEAKPDFKKAEQLINAATTDPTTKDDPVTWDVAGLIQRRYNELEIQNAYLKKPYDTLGVYNSVLKMYNYYEKCDDLAQIPNEKGKIKNKFRKPNAASLLIERPNLINGGIQYFNMNKNKEALAFFGKYVESVSLPIFEDESAKLKADTLLPQIAYYASLAAAKEENYDAIKKYAPFAIDDKEVGKFALEFLASAYKSEGDTAQWINTLKEGITKYPDHTLFFGYLIDYYSNKNQFDEAMKLTDTMLANNPNNSFFHYVKGYLLHNMKKYDEAIEFYNKTIGLDPNYAEAYSNLGLIYCLKAQDFADKSSTNINDPKYAQDQAQIKKFYEQAKPYYEKVRELKPDSKELWLQGLYRVYYSLNMGKEFKEIEEMM